MALPSFDNAWRNDKPVKPRILILEIKDKDRPDAKTPTWVLVEREETYQRDPAGTILEASIRLSYQLAPDPFSYWEGEKGFFSGGYSSYRNTVSLVKGAVFLDLKGLRGQRIGTYLMNEIVQWAQQWPEATIDPIALLEAQADSGNKARRNRFYERFGLVFDYTDPEHKEGRSQPMPASSLRQVETWKQNIIEHQMLDYLAAVLDAKEHATSELEARAQACTELIAKQRRAEAQPLRWAMRHLYYRHSSTVVALLFCTAIGVAVFKAL